MTASTSINGHLEVETVAARDGTPLLTRWWPTAGDPWGTILVVHGLGEHSGCHDATGGRFAAAGLVATSYDHRGFGASGGRRAYVDEWDDLLDDVEDRLDAGRTDGLPAAIYAHSLGAFIVADYLLSDRAGRTSPSCRHRRSAAATPAFGPSPRSSPAFGRRSPSRTHGMPR